MKIFFRFWALLHVFDSTLAELNLRFLYELISHPSSYSPVYNIIICSELDNIDLIKKISDKFQNFVAFHTAEKDLKPFLEEPQAFFLDVQCPEVKRVLKQAEDLNLFGKPFQWYLLREDVISNSTNETEIYASESERSWFWPFLQTLSLLIDSDVKVIETGSDGKISVTGVYKLQNSLRKEPLLEWSSNDGLVVLNFKSSPTRRWNLEGLTLLSSIVVTHLDSLKHLDDLVDKHVDTTTKVCYNMVRIFADLFNASISYKIQNEWGVLKNGSWTGMVGEFERKEIDFGAAPLFPQAERMHFLEHFASVTPTRVKFIFLSPPLSYSSNIFAMPFDRMVWWCCFALVAISCFLLFMALNYEKSHSEIKGKKNQREKEKKGNKYSNISFSEILILNIGAICLQGTVASTKNPPGRIITLFLYLSYMFLYISYSASIVAILQSSDISIQTLSDFLKSPLKAGADEVAYSQYYFKIADDEVRKAIYRTKIAPKNEAPHFLAVEDGIKEVRKGFYGFHVEVSVGYQVIQKTFTEEEKCALQELRDSFFWFADPWLVMKKKTPYAELFKIGMKMCIERGFKSRFVRRYYTKKPICASKSSRFVSVGILDCYYAFILLIGGFIAAFMIMILEISFRGYQRRREKSRPALNNNFIPRLEFFN